MERAEIKGSARCSSEPVLKKRKRAKLEAAGAKRPPKRRPDEVFEGMTVDAGYIKEGQAEVGKTRKMEKKRGADPFEDEMEWMMALDAGSSKEEGSDPTAQPTLYLSEQEYTEDLVVREVMSYMLSAPPLLSFTSYLDAKSVLGYPLGLRIAAYLNQRTEFDANMLRQYHTNANRRTVERACPCRPRPKPDEVECTGMVDAGSSGKRRKKVVRWRLSQELLDYMRTREVMGFLTTGMPCPHRLGNSPDLFDQELKEDIAAEFEDNREFDAYVLYQYRSKGYVEMQEEASDAEEEDNTDSRDLQEAARVIREWFVAGIKGNIQ